MENIDEREIDAARFSRQVQDIWRNHGMAEQRPEVGPRLAVVLLFTELMRGQQQLPWSRADMEDSQSLQDTMREAYKWLGLHDVINDNEWKQVSQSALSDLWSLVAFEDDHSVMLKRLDFLVQQLGEGIQREHALSRKVERFIADFFEGWHLHDGDVADLNGVTNGELGVLLNTSPARDDYVLPLRSHPHIFEVCLRLHAHNVRFRLVQEIGAEDSWTHVGFASGFPPIRERRSVHPFHDVPIWKASGLEFVRRFLSRGYRPRLAAIVLPTTDLRVRAWCAEVRKNLLSMGDVIGVIELPKRVSGRVQLSMLIVRTGHSSNGLGDVLLMNGQAVDGLRDEPLDRLAQFLSIPFRQSLFPDEGIPPDRLKMLGEALYSRSRKMFDSNIREFPGFFKYVRTIEILQTQHAVLDPSQWIPERERLVASDLLDGTPIHRLLADERLACCVYVIGNNGAGKSMLLRQLAKAFAASGRSVRAIASASSDRFDTKVGKNIDYVYLGARTSDTATHPHILGGRLADLIRSIHFDNDKSVAFNQILELLCFSGRHYLLPETASSDILESVREFGSEPIDGNLKGWKLGFRKADANSIVPFDHLSTGEQQVLLLTARLVAHAAAGVIFLIDEPETSLHVAWQRALPQVFQTISREFMCQMVIATHSPVLISTAGDQDTFRFMAEGGVLEEIGEQAASSVERVLFQGFDTYTGNNREVHERCAELVSQAIDLVNTSRSDQLPRILNELQEMDVKIVKSVPSLGSSATAKHLSLIRSARKVVSELAQPVELESSTR